MKVKIRILLSIIVMVFFSIICKNTYSVYKSTATGTASPKAADWVFNINGTDLDNTQYFTINASDLHWNNSFSNAKTGTIAPGTTGTIDIEIDATGTKVPLEYVICIDSIYGRKSNGVRAVSINYDDLTELFTYDYCRGGRILYNQYYMGSNSEFDIAWDYDDDDLENYIDMSYADYDIYISFSVNVKQYLN